MLVHFFGSVVRYSIIAVTVITVLHQIGGQTASLLAVLASAGLAIGLALQGTLSNIAAVTRSNGITPTVDYLE
jgi:small conductance mechanosensitive channel